MRDTRRFARLALLALAPSLAPGCQPGPPEGQGLVLLPSDAPLAPGVEKRDERLNFHDFGRVPDGDEVRHVFRLRNSDPRPVTIQKVTPGCGCTVASLRTVHADGSVERGQPISAKPPLLTVLPGELAEIEVRMATRELQTKNADRLVTMAVATDSPNGYYLSLEVHIFVETPFFVVPTALGLGRIPVSGGGEGKVEIVPAGARSHQLKELEPLPEGVHAELTHETRNGTSVWTLRAGYDPPLALGPHTATLRIATEDHEGKPGRPVEVPMAAQAVPDLAAEPERLVFASPGGAGGSATTELGSLLAGHRLRVTGVEVPEADRAYLSAEFAPVEADDAGTSLRWRISLAARSPLPDKDLIAGQLLVRLDDPQHPSVPLDFVIHRKK